MAAPGTPRRDMLATDTADDRRVRGQGAAAQTRGVELEALEGALERAFRDQLRPQLVAAG